VAEARIKGFESDHWYALLAPDGVEALVVSSLNDDFGKAIDAGDVSERLLTLGFDTRRSTPAEFAVLVRDGVAKSAKVVKASGISAR